jgi:2-hydroxymuconate-semialdehyde hydrolase
MSGLGPGIVLGGLTLVAAASNVLPHPPTGDPIWLARRFAVAPAETVATAAMGAGRPIVIIPGILGSAFGFRKVSAALADSGFHVVVVDPLGTGSSGRPSRADYSLTAQSRRIAAVMDSLRLRGAILVCHAVGASEGLRLAASRPDLVAGLVSINGGPAEQAATPGIQRALRFAPLIRLLGGRGLIRHEVRSRLASSSADPSWVTKAVIDAYTAPFAADLGRSLAALRGMVNAREDEPLSAQLPGIHVPVRLLVGVAPHVPSMAADEVAELAAGLRDFAVDSISGVGEYIQEERPMVVVGAVIRLLQRTQAEGRDVGTIRGQRDANAASARGDPLRPQSIHAPELELTTRPTLDSGVDDQTISAGAPRIRLLDLDATGQLAIQPQGAVLAPPRLDLYARALWPFHGDLAISDGDMDPGTAFERETQRSVALLQGQWITRPERIVQGTSGRHGAIAPLPPTRAPATHAAKARPTVAPEAGPLDWAWPHPTPPTRIRRHQQRRILTGRLVQGPDA